MAAAPIAAPPTHLYGVVVDWNKGCVRSISGSTKPDDVSRIYNPKIAMRDLDIVVFSAAGVVYTVDETSFGRRNLDFVHFVMFCLRKRNPPGGPVLFDDL